MDKFGTDLIKTPNFESELSVEGAKTSVSTAQNYSIDNSETNGLLMRQNQLLELILEKDTGISESAIFKSVQNSANSYFKMTSSYIFNFLANAFLRFCSFF